MLSRFLRCFLIVILTWKRYRKDVERYRNCSSIQSNHQKSEIDCVTIEPCEAIATISMAGFLSEYNLGNLCTDLVH